MSSRIRKHAWPVSVRKKDQTKAKEIRKIGGRLSKWKDHSRRRRSPSPQRYERPDCCDHSKRPRPLQKPVDRAQRTRPGETEHVPAGALLEATESNIKPTANEAEERQSRASAAQLTPWVVRRTEVRTAASCEDDGTNTRMATRAVVWRCQVRDRPQIDSDEAHRGWRIGCRTSTSRGLWEAVMA